MKIADKRALNQSVAKAIGEALCKARINADLSQAAVCELSGGFIKQRDICEWEKGVRPVPVQAVAYFAKVYGVSTDMLLGREYDRLTPPEQFQKLIGDINRQLFDVVGVHLERGKNYEEVVATGLLLCASLEKTININQEFWDDNVRNGANLMRCLIDFKEAISRSENSAQNFYSLSNAYDMPSCAKIND